MRSSLTPASFLACALLAGCGGGAPSSADPGNLPALTAEDLAQIKQQDQKVEEEERAQVPRTTRR